MPLEPRARRAKHSKIRMLRPLKPHGGAGVRRTKIAPAREKRQAQVQATTTWAGRVPLLKPGTYADGLPLHDVRYLCCKLILRPNGFRSRKSLFEFAKMLQEPAERAHVTFSRGPCQDEPIQIREVLFVDTPDFRLYNNGFILRRRIRYEEGFPVDDPEIVFKFRHSDMQKAAETDVRPHILGDHRVKFKCQVLPLKGELGGIRMLYSHNVQFPRSNVGESDVFAMSTLTRIFPALSRIKKAPDEKIALVSDAIIEEVLQNIGVLHFGQGIRSKASVSLWRTRGEHRPLIGEFSFQIRFADRKELDLEAMKRAEEFFIALQYAAQEWITLTATKTGVVYRLCGNTPTSHE
jgi:hypothetical protein